MGNKPLIAYTIEAAIGSIYVVDRLIVSTDDSHIAKVSKNYGASTPFLRPKRYATDEAKAIEVVKHALIEMEKIDCIEYSVIVYLEPPAPFKTSKDIDECINYF